MLRILSCFVGIAISLGMIACGSGGYPKKVFVYHQELLEAGDNKGFEDFIAINDYSNGSMTVMDFYKIARKEARGGNGARSVRTVNFLGRNEKDYKAAYSADDKNKDKKDFVITFQFRPDASTVKQPWLHGILLWKDGDSVAYTGNGAVDSLLQAPEKLSNR